MTATISDNKSDQIKLQGISSERKDVRVHKEYGLILNVRMTLGDLKVCKGCIPWDVRFNLYDIIEDLPYATHKGYYGGWGWEMCKSGDHKHKTEHYSGVSLKFYIKASRPSEILSESQALRVIAGKCPENAERTLPLSLEQILRQRIIKQLEKLEEAKTAHNIAWQANNIIKWATNEADKQAQEELLYQEKIERLQAELKEAQKVHLQKVLTNIHTKFPEDGGFSPRAWELAREKAHEHLPSPNVSLRFLRSDNPPVKKEDV